LRQNIFAVYSKKFFDKANKFTVAVLRENGCRFYRNYKKMANKTVLKRLTAISDGLVSL
jgi:hypothetical protein